VTVAFRVAYLCPNAPPLPVNIHLLRAIQVTGVFAPSLNAEESRDLKIRLRERLGVKSQDVLASS